MFMPKPKKVRVWNKGQVTIPMNLRQQLGITDDSILNMVQIGNAIFMTSRNPKLPKLAREFQEIMKENKITEKDLLLALKQVRKHIFAKKHEK